MHVYSSQQPKALGKPQRRGSSQGHASERTTNISFHNYHKMSETFTDNFPIKPKKNKPPANYFKQTKKQPTLSLEEIDQKIEYRSQPFTFNQEPHTDQHQMTQTFLTGKNKKFDFENYQETSKQRDQNSFFGSQNPSKSFMMALDDYIDYLSQSENVVRSTLQTDQSDTMMLQKLNVIKEYHERIMIRCRKAQDKASQLKKENELYATNLLETKLKLESEVEKNLKLHEKNNKLQKAYRNLVEKAKYLQNSLLKVKMENENNRILYKRISQHMSPSPVIPTPESSESEFKQIDSKSQRDVLLSQYLQQQMNYLKRNNKDIQRIQHSLHVTRRQSEDSDHSQLTLDLS